MKTKAAEAMISNVINMLSTAMPEVEPDNGVSMFLVEMIDSLNFREELKELIKNMVVKGANEEPEKALEFLKVLGDKLDKFLEK